MDSIMYYCLIAAYILLFVIGVMVAQRNGSFTIENTLLIVILALLYDNGILAMGKYIGEGELLRTLNLLRYIFHALITPLLILFSWRTLVNANIRRANRKVIKWSFAALTFGLIVFDLVAEVWGIHLKPVLKNGVLYYEKTGGSNLPPIMVIGVMLSLFITSIIVWWKQKWPWYFLGVAAMGITPLLSFFLKTQAAHNISEFLLMTALLSTKAYQEVNS